MSYLFATDSTDEPDTYGLGDDVVGVAHVAIYAPGDKDDEHDPFKGEGGEIVYFITKCRTTNLPEVRDAFTVEYRITYWEDREDYRNGGEVTYDMASILYYYSLESAQRECDRLGHMDESYVFSFEGDRARA